MKQQLTGRSRLAAMVFGAIGFAVMAGAVGCSRDEARENMKNAAANVADAARDLKTTVEEKVTVSVPLGESPKTEQIERERFSTTWRQEQSFTAPVPAPAATTAAPGTFPSPAVVAPDATPAPALAADSLPAAAPATPLQFATTGPAEKLAVLDPAAIDSLPLRVPVKGDVSGASVLRAQVLLDRARYSVGAIDGRWGKNSAIAAYWFQRDHGLPPTGDVDQATFEALSAAAGSDPTLVETTLTAEDLAGPFVTIPEDVYEKEKLDCMCYETAIEMLAERSHATEKLLAVLNPELAGGAAPAVGQMLVLPNVRPPLAQTAPKDVARIIVSVDGNYVHAQDASGRTIFHAPTTVGSKYDPSPNETHKIVATAWKPDFHYQPTLFADVPDTDAEAHLKPGPNSPVGVVWMALDRKHFGIHGTNDPDTIGYASSHGCVRLANWDAQDLARRTPKGTAVEFVDTH